MTYLMLPDDARKYVAGMYGRLRDPFAHQVAKIQEGLESLFGDGFTPAYAGIPSGLVVYMKRSYDKPLHPAANGKNSGEFRPRLRKPAASPRKVKGSRGKWLSIG